MGKLIFLLLLYSASLYSQSDIVGRKDVYVNENGISKRTIILNPLPNTGNSPNFFSNENSYPGLNVFNNTAVRWNYTEPAAIGDFCQTSGNGKYSVVGWDLNNKRISLYGNSDPTTIWDFPTDPNGFTNFVSISDTGGVIAAGSYQNIYLFTNASNVPFFNFDLTRLADTGVATSLDLTKDGKFLIAAVSRQDSSTIFGFNSSSTNPAWSKRIVPLIVTGGAAIQGVKISGNDSVAIINTYAEFYVVKTFTGELLYHGLINPVSSSNGTQAVQGISGDGSIIATINYSGFIRAYQWNGATYNFLWTNQEPPGMFFNWYTTVDVSYDGNLITAGTLNFLSTSTYDGKIKVFKKSGSGSPLWTFAGCGDEVTAVSFSKNANILTASTWGEFNNTTEDLYIFKTFTGNTPIFKVNTPGSFFYCSTSNDGRTVVASGKAVHARQFGSGGILYNIAVDTTDIPPTLIGSTNSNLAGEYKLYQNYPNPFNPETKIKFDIPSKNNRENVTLIIYNTLGRSVETLVDQSLSSGSYEINFNASKLSSGIYYYKLTTPEFSDTRKLILLK